jgi:AraC-like DNA-binding protein
MHLVKTFCILPNPILSPYIRHYAIRVFDSGHQEMVKPMLADHEITMAFFLRCKIHDFRPLESSIPIYTLRKSYDADCYFIGLQTSAKGFAIFKGETTLLNIHFKPVGFMNIFNISPKEIKDRIDDSEDILSREVNLIHEELHDGRDFTECIQILEKYLIKKLTSYKLKYKHPSIRSAADYLIKEKGLYPIRQLAYHCNMTLQTFEVQFTEQVGIVPKLYSQLVRFGWTVELKLNNPTMSWTEIGHTCGYYDQNHLVKEFKKFSTLTPNKFLEKMHPIVENYEFDTLP